MVGSIPDEEVDTAADVKGLDVGAPVGLLLTSGADVELELVLVWELELELVSGMLRGLVSTLSAAGLGTDGDPILLCNERKHRQGLRSEFTTFKKY